MMIEIRGFTKVFEKNIEIRGFTKASEKIEVVSQLDVSVSKGSIHGFLGTNGAGKTTTIRVIMGHLHPTSGEIRTLGTDPWQLDDEQKRRIAYVSENMEVPFWMTPERAIQFRSAFYPKWNTKLADILLDEFHLRNEGAFKTLSKGNKRKLCILLALCQNADLLIMDEPASGLDVAARREFLERVLDIACDGDKTVFFSSHQLSDLERIVDRITMISQGKKLLDGDLETMKRSIREIHLAKVIDRETMQRDFSVIRYNSDNSSTRALLYDFNEERFRAFCEKHQCSFGAEANGLNLEDLFVELEKNREAIISTTERK